MTTVAWRASFSYLARHPWQLFMTTAAIAIGVAAIVAVDIANSSARRAFTISMDAVIGGATHQLVGGPKGVDESLYSKLRTTAGAPAMAPVLAADARIADTDVQLFGIDLFAEGEFRRFSGEALDDSARESGLEVLGRFLSEPGSVFMSAELSEQFNVEPGDRLSINVAGREHQATLLGTYDSEAGARNIVTADLASVQAWTDRQGWLTRIDVRLESEAQRQAFEVVLPDDVVLLAAAGRTANTADLSAAFITNLTAMSLLALLVGIFLIYNSVSFSVLQRRDLIGTLRALGVTRRQVLAFVLTEALCLGAIGAGFGVMFGEWIGAHLVELVVRSINDFYFRLSVTEPSLGSLTILKGVAAGVLASLLAAVVPALEASAYSPRLAMARSVLEAKSRSALPWLLMTGAALVAASLLLLSLGGENLVSGLFAVFLLIIGFALAVPYIVHVLSMRLSAISGIGGGMLAKLALSGISASLSRTGVAIVALAVAVSATIGVTVMVDSFRGSVAAWLDQTLQADFYVSGGGVPIAPDTLSQIRNLTGVEHVSTSRRISLEDASGITRLVVIDMAPDSYAGTEIIESRSADPWPEWESADTVLASEPYAFRHDVEPGDVIALRTGSGIVAFKLLATYKSYDVNASALLMSRTVYDRYWQDDAIDSIGIYLADEIDDQKVIDEVGGIGDAGQPLRIASNRGIKETSLEIFDRTFLVTDVLYWLASGVAVIGILSALMALQLERRREFATLRALGMTPSQIRGLVMLQSSIMGFFSGLAAIPLGIVMAYVLIVVINRRAFGWQIDMDVSAGSVLAGLMFAVGAAAVGSIYPALRASSGEPALAMREE